MSNDTLDDFSISSSMDNISLTEPRVNHGVTFDPSIFRSHRANTTDNSSGPQLVKKLPDYRTLPELNVLFRNVTPYTLEIRRSEADGVLYISGSHDESLRSIWGYFRDRFNSILWCPCHEETDNARIRGKTHCIRKWIEEKGQYVLLGLRFHDIGEMLSSRNSSGAFDTWGGRVVLICNSIQDDQCEGYE
jgi:hypothetical protein